MQFKPGKRTGPGPGGPQGHGKPQHQPHKHPANPTDRGPQDRGPQERRPQERQPQERKDLAYSRVVLELRSVECVDTTKEIDKDEMVLVGIASNAIRRANGKAGTKTDVRAKIALGKFKKGTKRTFDDPKTIASFVYGGAQADWPRTYPAALLLVELDENKIGTLAAKVADAIDEELAEKLGEAAATAAATLAAGAAGAIGAGAAAGSVIPVIGTAVGAAVAGGVVASVSAIKKAKLDDAFPPKAVPLELRHAPAAAGEVPDTRQKHVLSAHGGTYEVVTVWSVA